MTCLPPSRHQDPPPPSLQWRRTKKSPQSDVAELNIEEADKAVAGSPADGAGGRARSGSVAEAPVIVQTHLKIVVKRIGTTGQMLIFV